MNDYKNTEDSKILNMSWAKHYEIELNKQYKKEQESVHKMVEDYKKESDKDLEEYLERQKKRYDTYDAMLVAFYGIDPDDPSTWK